MLFPAWFRRLTNRSVYRRRFGAVRAVEGLECRTLLAAFVVDSLADESDGDFSSGDLTLREAIESANALAGADTISFEPSLFTSPQTLTMSLGQFEITDSVTISGPGMDMLIIDANRQSRVMEIDDGNDTNQIDVSISDLTIANGNATDGNDSQTSPLDSGGAISVTENLLLTSVSLTKNQARLVGGAIISFSSSNLELRKTKVVENVALSNDSNFGGGIASAGDLAISGSQFVDNYSGDFGGAVYGYRSSVMAIVNTTFSGNRGSTIRNRGIATLENSSVLHSVSAGIANDGTMVISNSTISGNMSRGIRNDSTGDLTVLNSTITANENAETGAGVWNDGKLHVAHSIVADNYQRNGTPSDLVNDNIFNSPILTGSHNIIGDPYSSGGLQHGVNGNILGQPNVSGGRELLDIESLLEPLADHGGPTLTHRLVPGSLAVDAGDPDFDPNAIDPPVLYDQRGELFARVIDGDANGSAIIDIGAFEAPRTGNLVVSETDGDTEVFETGQTDAVSVRLERQPNSSVVVNVASTDSGLVMASETRLIFTVNDWDQPQTVTLLAVEDTSRTSHSVTNVTFTTDAAQSDSDFNNAAETIDVQFLDTEASLTVDSIVDESDGDFGSGDLSLREALEIANADTDVDVIVFSPVVFDSPQTILLSEGELLISNTVRVIGPGRELLTIDANEHSRVLLVDDGDENVESVVKVKQLKIARGRADDGDDDEYTLDDIGGGIFNLEALELRDFEVNDSYARHPDSGGGIHNEGSLVFEEGLAVKNEPSAVYNSVESTLVANDVHILDNDRRGLVNAGDAELHRVSITGSGTSGLFNSGLSLHLTNSTISGNGFGGIVYDVRLGGGTFEIVSSTITNNIVPSDPDYGGLTILRGFSAGGTGRISNSIVAGNYSDAGEPRDFSPDAVMSGSYNLIGTPDQAEHLIHGQDGNIVGQDDDQGGRESLDISSILTPLADNGGFSPTHAVIPGSLAVDAGDPFYDQRYNVQTDQRGAGFARIENGDAMGTTLVDIGAFELPRIGTLVVEATDGRSEIFETGESDTFVVSLNRLPNEPVVVTATSGTAMATVTPTQLTFTPANWNQPQTITVQAVTDGVETGHLQVSINLAVDAAASDNDFDDATNSILFRFVDAEGSIVVDNTGDAADGDFSAGELTLREAIELTNADLGIDLIEFDATVFAAAQTITLTGGQLSVTDELTIVGPGRELLTIDANQQSRVLQFDDGDVELVTRMQASGFTLVNGKVTERDPSLFLFAGGAILNRESLTLTDIAIRNSEAEYGAGIFSDAELTVTDGIFERNSGVYGAGITNRLGSLELTVGNFVENLATFGGGIWNSGHAAVRQATFENARASQGGAIWNRGQLVVREITASDNLAFDSGGGIYHTAPEEAAMPGSLSVRRATILNNRSLQGETAAEDPGAGITIAGARIGDLVEISNTLFAGNVVVLNTDRRSSELTSDQPITGGFNLFSDPRLTGGFTHGMGGNIVGQDDGNGGRGLIDAETLVAPLMDNEGLAGMRTHALLPNSIAIDAGHPSFDGDTETPTVDFDQRGEPFARTFDGDGDGTARIDIGAFELAAFTLVVVQSDGSTIVDEGSADSVAVSLSRAPVEPVVVNVNVENEDRLSTDTASLTFTADNWSQPQTVTVTGIEDDAETGDLLTSLNLAVADETSDDAFDGRVATIVIDVHDNDDPAASGDVDGDADFDANDSFLIQLVQLAASDAQIDISKGSSPLSATQIRAAIAGMQASADVDGDNDFDANDAFLIHLVKLSGTNANIDSSKGSSSLTAAEIRARIDALNGNGGTTATAHSSPKSIEPQPPHPVSNIVVNSTHAESTELAASVLYRDWLSAVRL